MNSFFFCDDDTCILNLFLTNKVYCLGFFKTCLFLWPPRKGFSLARLLTFAKSLVSRVVGLFHTRIPSEAKDFANAKQGSMQERNFCSQGIWLLM